jgi:cysteinyl-tRNA synthetase
MEPFELHTTLNDADSVVAQSPPTQSTTNKSKGLACYTCGPTVYAPAHLGHARTYVWLDILRRVLEFHHQTTVVTDKADISLTSPPPPLFVLNITDVDDKILAEARKRSEAPLNLARRYETEFWRDWDALHCLRPHVVTRVTEHVESVIAPYIQRLIDLGMAYTIAPLLSSSDTLSANENKDTHGADVESSSTEYGGVYFDVGAYEELMGTRTRYGKLAPSSQSTDLFHRHSPTSLESALVPNGSAVSTEPPTSVTPSEPLPLEPSLEVATVQPDAHGKRNERDFVLWKLRKSGETMYWDSPWGLGRPGWHIECSAMIHAVAQQFQATHSFGLHSGGVDLKFPHHTNEIAQAEAFYYKSSESGSAENTSMTALSSNCEAEWIRHWVHTGHLHIDGLKMSKSLKNFISIRDYLTGATEETTAPTPNTEVGSAVYPLDARSIAQQQERADDFRLWCLGLSGSYRGPATYSAERMKEAGNVRRKIVNFLLQGEEWLLRCDEADPAGESSRKWSDDDFQFHTLANNAVAKCHGALRSDLDGSTYVEQLVLISERGRAFLNNQPTAVTNGYAASATEPIRFALQSVRSLLSLVGFTDATCGIGLKESHTAHSAGMEGQNIPRALIQELARFRSAVRRAAIEDHKNQANEPTANMKLILKLCDQARDEIFPALGVELIDTGTGMDSDSSEHGDDWRFCAPRNAVSKMNAVAMNSAVRRAITADTLRTIPPQLLFKVGTYEGLFSEYNEDGFPLRTIDGAELSNTQVKKLRKTFARHITRWQRWVVEGEKRVKDNVTKKKKREFDVEVERLTLQLAAERSTVPRPDADAGGT